MHWKSASQIAFALTFIAIGVIGLASGSFAPIWQPVPAAFPARPLLEWLTVLVALGCGAGLLIKRSATWAALILLIFLTVWTLVFKVPFIFRAPFEEGSYQSNGENAVLIAASWVLFTELAKNRPFPAGATGVRIAYILYGLALVAFGFSHFAYLELTAPLVPHWLHWPVFWAYATGAIYLACGLLVLVGATKVGSIGAAIEITLITILVWGPIVLAGSLSAMHWQETVVSVALSVSAWMLASVPQPGKAVFRVPFR